jgi:hypothetical protein
LLYLLPPTPSVLLIIADTSDRARVSMKGVPKIDYYISLGESTPQSY